MCTSRRAPAAYQRVQLLRDFPRRRRGLGAKYVRPVHRLRFLVSATGRLVALFVPQGVPF